jgi:hypothetical protein
MPLEEEATIVLAMYQSYLSGDSMGTIAWRLNQQGILTKRGNRWTVWSVSHILHNPIYAGFLLWDGKFLTTSHAAVVTKYQFELVQLRAAEMTKDRKKRSILRLGVPEASLATHKEASIIV